MRTWKFIIINFCNQISMSDAMNMFRRRYVSGRGGEASDDDEHVPHTRPSGLGRGESKRQKTDGNSDGSGPDFVEALGAKYQVLDLFISA